MLTIYLALIILLLLVLGCLKVSVAKPKNYPPGPTWYPYLGCGKLVQNMAKKYGTQWKGLSKLAEQYSTKVLGLKLGSEKVIVVFGDKNIRQVFLEKEFEGRPDSFFIRLRCFGKRMGITFADGPLWKEHRQFTLKHLKNIGFGKSLMEKEIQNEMMSIVSCIKSYQQKPMNPRTILPLSVTNTLWMYTAGETIEKNRLKSLLKLLNDRSKAFTMAGGWLNEVPWCRFFFPELSGYALIKKINQELSDIIDEAIEKHTSGSIQGSDFISAFLEEMKQNRESFTVGQLRTICLDLLIAGSQTTSNVIEFSILVMLRDQVLQERVFHEICTTIGNETPCWADSNRMPFTSAVLLEVQRYYTIVPLAGPRRVLADTIIDGYSIPKSTTVLIALGDLYFDQQYWEQPGDFKPERFINDNGNLTSAEHLYPFGLGRRRCPGDSLAKSFIFICFVGILQKYKIVPTNGVLPSNEPITGLISAPKEFTAEFIPRQ